MIATVDGLLVALEHELRETGRLSFATCEALRRDNRIDGLEGCLSFLRCTMFATDPDTLPISRRRRVQVCRLMLLSLGAHTDTPRSTSFQTEQLLEAAMQVPGAELSDLVQAQFALLGEWTGPATSAQANFLRQLAAQVIGKRALGHSVDDFVWIAVRLADPILCPATEAQAYLAALVLPRPIHERTRAIIFLSVGSSPLADEVAGLLAL